MGNWPPKLKPNEGLYRITVYEFKKKGIGTFKGRWKIFWQDDVVINASKLLKIIADMISKKKEAKNAIRKKALQT